MQRGAREAAPVDEGATQFGRYQLHSELASGGMASVWLARTTGAGGFAHVCAVKRVHPHLAKRPEFVDMFLDEARIAARIHHANVCRVFDFGLQDGMPFIAMEFLSGVSLSRLLSELSRRPRPDRFRAIVAIVAEAAAGLHAAHELRDNDGRLLEVVHRDISPQNLFLTFDGTVKVVDFGIASARGKVHATETGEVKGKFSYMAPEQMRGLSVDRRADVWSLGVVLWEMLTLSRLFRRPTQPETIDAVLRAPIDPPSQRSSEVPVALDAIVARALARDPSERFPTAKELEAALRGAETRATPFSRAELEQWVHALFPDAQVRTSRLLESLDSRLSPSEGRVPVEGGEASVTEPSQPATRALRPAPPAQPARLRRALWAVLALSVAAFGLIASRLTLRGEAAEMPAAEGKAATAPADRASQSSPSAGQASPQVVTPRTESWRETTSDSAQGMDPRPAAEAETPSEPPRPAERRSRARSTRAQRIEPVSMGSGTAPAAEPGSEPSTRSDEGGPTAEAAAGCIRVGLGLAVTIDGVRVDGPRVVPAPAGVLSVPVLDASGVIREVRRVRVEPGPSCARVAARADDAP